MILNKNRPLRLYKKLFEPEILQDWCRRTIPIDEAKDHRRKDKRRSSNSTDGDQSCDGR